MARKKRSRVEGDGWEGRTGIFPRGSNFVVEMRLSTKVAPDLKLQFGSYGTVEEAHAGRDYAAYVRNSTGKEDLAAVGGFDPNVHPSIYKFEESLEVIESLAGSASQAHARCNEYEELLRQPTAEARKKFCKKFCKAAREDIGVLIESFRSRDPENFLPPLTNRLPNAEPVDGEIHRTPLPSSSEVRVSPTLGREEGASIGEGSNFFTLASSLDAQIIVNGIPYPSPVLKNVIPLTHEEISGMAKAGKDAMETFHRELTLNLSKEMDNLIDVFLEGADSRIVEPTAFPALD